MANSIKLLNALGNFRGLFTVKDDTTATYQLGGIEIELTSNEVARLVICMKDFYEADTRAAECKYEWGVAVSELHNRILEFDKV